MTCCAVVQEEQMEEVRKEGWGHSAPRLDPIRKTSSSGMMAMLLS